MNNIIETTSPGGPWSQHFHAGERGAPGRPTKGVHRAVNASDQSKCRAHVGHARPIMPCVCAGFIPSRCADARAFRYACKPAGNKNRAVLESGGGGVVRD